MGARALFWDEDDARTVAARLARDGFAVAVGRHAFAGEDDDEDHPWAVTTDAPDAMLELLGEEHDGWVDHDVVAQSMSVPLPSAPRRHHRAPRAVDGDSPAGS